MKNWVAEGITSDVNDFTQHGLKKLEVSYAARNYEQFQIEFIHTYPHFYHSPKNKVVKTWLKFKFRINNICSKICSTNIAAFLLCLPKIIYYLQIVTVRPHLQYFLLLLSTQERRKLPKAGWASSNVRSQSAPSG